VSAEATAGARGAVEVTEPTPAQRAFARAVAESKATIPHVYFEEPVPRPPDLAAVVGAVARALREVPLLNGAYRDARFERYARVNVAVSIGIEGTLAFPVVHDADELEETAIALRIAELEQGSRERSLPSPAFAGATFSVIDMSDRVARFLPVINRGQAATLGAGSESLTLACDNRIVQAGEGAEFLRSLAAGLG
jgi:pyruvate dehydrogenase E2 component (dihydrolipoyllysine-residue acetyltransferase)